MKSHFFRSNAIVRTKFFRHDRRFYQHTVPDVYPLFAYDSVRTEALTSWRRDLRHQQGISVPPPPVMLEAEFEAGGIIKQRLLERQRLELLLCENPGYMLHYAQRLHDHLGINHGILIDYATSHHNHKFLNCILVSADFYYTWLGRNPDQWFHDSLDRWQLWEMIRAFNLEVPPEHLNPIPKTGLLVGEPFWEAVANIHSGRVFYPLDQLNEEGSGSAAGGAGASSGQTPAGGAANAPAGYLQDNSGASSAAAKKPVTLSPQQVATFKKAAKQGMPFAEVCA
ncbi:hypothetical protein [Acanthopleuribacter pedis]|uniref:Uncharacterized protein n=1 Tax=Acanthopleuribacter pedis TaxID=442870 RepID=A0A8J7Q8J0_9BACT|nr:hypothetical protein [Acanthopleuribacter pedis]MBO1319677.1 hypothetical protein [Acanthopleuribacter pedis]